MKINYTKSNKEAFEKRTDNYSSRMIERLQKEECPFFADDLKIEIQKHFIKTKSID